MKFPYYATFLQSYNTKIYLGKQQEDLKLSLGLWISTQIKEGITIKYIVNLDG